MVKYDTIFWLLRLLAHPSTPATLAQLFRRVSGELGRREEGFRVKDWHEAGPADSAGYYLGFLLAWEPRWSLCSRPLLRRKVNDKSDVSRHPGPSSLLSVCNGNRKITLEAWGQVGLCFLKTDEDKERRNTSSLSTAEQERQCRFAEKIEVALHVHVHIWEYLTLTIGTLHRKTGPKSKIQCHGFWSSDTSK